jgi:tetratricopeptide (TPR) repeat protein
MAVALTPGWLRSELMLEAFGATEDRWRDALEGRAPPDFALSESPRYVGRAVVALACAKRYPASANVYDSLAEAYEKKGQLDLAVTNYAKAVSVAEKDGQPNLEVFRANLERVTKQKQSAGAAK